VFSPLLVGKGSGRLPFCKLVCRETESNLLAFDGRVKEILLRPPDARAEVTLDKSRARCLDV
jgi:hypothetical protein